MTLVGKVEIYRSCTRRSLYHYDGQLVEKLSFDWFGCCAKFVTSVFCEVTDLAEL